MPFDFLKRKKEAPPAETVGTPTDTAGPAPAADAKAGRGISFDGLTEEWHLTGVMRVHGRLSDALNKREPISLEDVRWAPIDGSAEAAPAPGLKAIDPYDLVIVLATGESLPVQTDEEKSAHKIHKVAYDVIVEVPPFRVLGTVLLYPGSDPVRLMERATEMFVPLLNATATLGDRILGERMNAVLVNRFYLRGIEQVDRRTGEPPTKLPGQPLGGTSWQDNS